ncbi:NAD-dependent epimerase/dehydratase family protein [Streptomyces sp. NPDC006514]|uniref:NAD-dependent epimerase/dehydratase family protein n=1 Tax=Streptomyces sp. NPDC006514 TaxID=3154308 RepID=UPI0033B0BBEE
MLGKANVSHTSVRYFSVYGEPQTVKEGPHSRVVAWMAMRARLGLPLHLNGGGRRVRDFVHVDDIAAATIRALLARGADRQTLNIGTGGDHVRTGSMITLGPGIAVGRHSAIAAGVCMGSTIVPAGSVVGSSAPEGAIEPRRI